MDSIITKLENKALQCYQKLLTLGVECDVIEKDFLSRKKFHVNVISAAARGKLKESIPISFSNQFKYRRTV